MLKRRQEKKDCKKLIGSTNTNKENKEISSTNKEISESMEQLFYYSNIHTVGSMSNLLTPAFIFKKSGEKTNS